MILGCRADFLRLTAYSELFFKIICTYLPLLFSFSSLVLISPFDILLSGCRLQCAVGEALLNDGMALVLFTTLTSAELSTPGEIAIYFVRVFFFSPLVGVTLGLGNDDLGIACYD